MGDYIGTEPRYASLPNIMKAKKKPFKKMTLQDLGLEDQVKPRQEILKVAEPPKREGGAKVRFRSAGAWPSYQPGRSRRLLTSTFVSRVSDLVGCRWRTSTNSSPSSRTLDVSNRPPFLLSRVSRIRPTG